MINKNNYYLNTKATFRFVKEFDRNDVISSTRTSVKPVSQTQMIHMVSRALGIEPSDLEFNYSSYNSFWHTGSFYFYNKRTNEILRLSDHWSDSTNNKVNVCGKIRSCDWTLKTFKKDDQGIVGLKPRCRYYNYQLAKCKLNNFKNI